MCVAKQVGTWIVFTHEDNGVNPFGWQSMVALLNPWEPTGMERLQMNKTWG